MTALVAVLIALAAAMPAEAPAPRQLVLGVPLTAGLARGEARSFEIEKGAAAWRAGTPLLITVEQLGIDVVLDVVAPDGGSLGPVDSPTDRDGAESLLIPAAAAAGHYRVEVRAAAGGMPPGSFEVHAEPLLARSAGERRRLAAETEMSEAGRLFARGGAAAKQAAAARLEAALRLWREAGDRAQQARALYWLAAMRGAIGESRQALALYGRALPLWQALGSAGREADTLTGMGLASWRLGDNDAALAAFDRALAAARQRGDRHRAAAARNDACLVRHSRGELEQALACYESVLASLQGQGEERQEAVLLLNSGGAYDSLGEPRLALARYEQAKAALRVAGDRQGEAQALNNLAVVWSGLGDKGKALATYGQALDIFRAAGDRLGEARALNNLGFTYFALGETARAVDYYDQALALRRALGDRRGEASTLDNLGSAYGAGGEHQRATAAAREALALARAVTDKSAAADALSLLGHEQAAAGDLAAAVATLGDVATARRATGDRAGLADAMEELGKAHLAAGDPGSLEQALAAVEQALAARRALADPGGQVAALATLARIEWRRGRLAPARSLAEEALRLLESLRSAIASPELRATFLATQRQAYETEIGLLMDLDRAEPGQGHAREAFAVSERARARALLDLLAEARLGARPGGAPDFQRRRQALDERLRAKHRRRLDLAARGAGAAEQQAADRAVQAVLRELDQLELEVGADHPRYAQLTRTLPLTAADVQGLLDPGTLLLEYALGEERSFLWVVGAGATASFTLPGRAAIEERARRVYAGLHAPSLDAAEAETARQEALALSRLLLGPAGDRLGDRRLVVVADGALVYLPFAALPEPGDEARPLVARHEVVSLPSASLLPLLRQGFAGRPAATRTVAIVADPVFSAADPRAAAGGGGAGGGGTGGGGGGRATVAGPARTAGEAPPPGGTAAARLDRLPATRREAETIAALLPAGEVRLALDREASRELVLAGELAPYRIVHFATHGVIDAQDPALSGLELSRVGADAAPRDGFLSLGDIYGLRLGADLVVLSGCETGLGKAIRGEGLAGLVQGFLVAGANRVVASLWQVPDRATAELMGRFYHAMLAERLPAAAALRRAQLAIAGERRWRAPYYWASFVLLGDWR